MIQRRQTLYLILSLIANLAVVYTPIADRLLADPADWIRWLYLGLIGLNTLLLLVGIATFGNRPRQAVLVRVATLLFTMILAMEVAVLLTLGGIGTYLWDEALSILLTGAGLGLSGAARSAILADEALVKSMDRLR